MISSEILGLTKLGVDVQVVGGSFLLSDDQVLAKFEQNGYLLEDLKGTSVLPLMMQDNSCNCSMG